MYMCVRKCAHKYVTERVCVRVHAQVCMCESVWVHVCVHVCAFCKGVYYIPCKLFRQATERHSHLDECLDRV